MKNENRPRRKNDEMLKGAFEENFFDFLRFVYPDADKILDFNKAPQFMDKELHAIIPDRERKNDKRIADLLAKLYLKDGTEKWILLNVEVEGGKDADFAYRIYQYNYRIRDRYSVSVATIAVFTGGERQPRPGEYFDELLGTALSFKYLNYHVFDHSEQALIDTRNPFALIVLACQKALLEGKIPDEALSNERLNIVKALLSRGYDHERIINFVVFIKNFLYVGDSNINRNFDRQIEELTERKINRKMGIIEVLKMQAQRDGLEEGLEKGLEQGREEAEAKKNHDFVESLILELGLPDSKVAKVAKVPLAFVKKVRAEINSK